VIEQTVSGPETAASLPLPSLRHSLTRAERFAAGKARRETVPRSSHASWVPPGDRTDPIELLLANSQGREAHLVPIRFGRMKTSPFAFLRGSAVVMASDLSRTPNSGLHVQACGDCHLLNFGGFATPERNLVFDLNDFDETLPAPWEWDLKRLAASFAVAGRAFGFSDRKCREAAESVGRVYRTQMAVFAEMKALEVWYAKIDVSTLLAIAPTESTRRRRQALIDKAQRRTAEFLYPRLTEIVHGRRRIIDMPPLIYHLPPTEKFHDDVRVFFTRYHDSLPDERRVLLDRYEFVDLVVKVVGIGSVGTLCGVALFLAEDDDPLFLQLKEARASVLEPYTKPSVYENHAQRVVCGQRLMQSASDAFLGWSQGPSGRDFYVRQLRDMKVSPDLEDVPLAGFLQYAEICGWSLARAHARSGDAAMIAGYLGKREVFDEALGEFSLDYADQTERDHEALVREIRNGRVSARELDDE